MNIEIQMKKETPVIQRAFLFIIMNWYESYLTSSYTYQENAFPDIPAVFYIQEPS
jgi:hypothetical protein